MNQKEVYSTKALDGIRNHMLAAGHSLSVAESVTSGHLQAAFSLATEASRFFHGGITVYNLGQKARHLHIDPIFAMSCNSVSQQIADAMALNTIRLFTSDWSIAVTGYASPLPENGIHDLFAFFAIASRDNVVSRGRIESRDKGMLAVQVHYVNVILERFHNFLSSHLVVRDGVGM